MKELGHWGKIMWYSSRYVHLRSFCCLFLAVSVVSALSSRTLLKVRILVKYFQDGLSIQDVIYSLKIIGFWDEKKVILRNHSGTSLLLKGHTFSTANSIANALICGIIWWLTVSLGKKCILYLTFMLSKQLEVYFFPQNMWLLNLYVQGKISDTKLFSKLHLYMKVPKTKHYFIVRTESSHPLLGNQAILCHAVHLVLTICILCFMEGIESIPVSAARACITSWSYLWTFIKA